MKPAESHEELVRFHRKNLGIMKESHPAYLNVSPKVVPMLDHVILTFVYVESLRQEQAGRRSNSNNTNLNNMMMMNNMNNINNINNINNMNNVIMTTNSAAMGGMM